MRGLIDDNCVFDSLITCSMNPETAVTFTRGHFNQAVFAVYKIFATCIEGATMLQTNNTRVMCEYKAGEGVTCYSRLIN